MRRERSWSGRQSFRPWIPDLLADSITLTAVLGTPPSSAVPSSAAGSQLTIVVDDGTGAATTWTLTCDPVGGTHPDPEAACSALAEHRSALRPVPKNKMCAQVYGGPERATISGTWGDEQVLASLSRVNSCETARWDALVPVVPAGGR